MSWPTAGAGWQGSAGVSDSFMGLPVIFTLPIPGWSISTSISRARMLGFSQASSTVHRGPQGMELSCIIFIASAAV